jgi:type I restriction enzyme R subunit
MTFELFDPRAEVAIREGKLPHWYQAGVTYFVTFRTEDSVPRALLRSWHARREHWLRKHGIDPAGPTWKAQLRCNAQLEIEYHAAFIREFMEYLDRGHGACPLADANLAAQVTECLFHFDGDRYHLGDFVVMPNHVHLLVCLLGTTEIETQCRSWKKFSATQINRLRGGNGRFWQEESFDHLVRSDAQFEHFRCYIAGNPVKARLSPGSFAHYECPK